MQAYVIIFQNPSRAEVIGNYIHAYGTWGRVADNAWIVVTDKTAANIRDEILSLKASDGVMVIRSGAVAAWNNVPARSDWLKKYL